VSRIFTVRASLGDFPRANTFSRAPAEIHIRTFPNAIIEQFVMPALKFLKLFGIDPMSPKSRDLLTDFSGLLRPGEMCLVLARPGGGASTFLKAITNNRESYQKVEGEVVYQGLSAKEMKKKYAGEILYSEEGEFSCG
jgi:ATP-binding cassette subfamily G (WHITE) protein 2 (SNQ2)